MKRYLSVFLTAALCMALCGCTAAEVSEKAYVKLMAVAKDDKSISVHIRVMYASDGEGQEDTISGSGSDFVTALEDAQKSCPRIINIGHCELIVLDKRLDNITSLLLPLVTERDVSPICYAAVSEDCESIADADAEISDMAKVLSEMGGYSPVTAASYLSAQLSGKPYSILPALEYDGDRLLCSGLTAIRNGSCVSDLSADAQAALNLLSGVHDSVRSITMADGYIAKVRITSLSVRGELPEVEVILRGTLRGSRDGSDVSPYVAAYALKRDIESEIMTLYRELTGIKKSENEMFSPVMRSITSEPASTVICTIE